MNCNYSNLRNISYFKDVQINTSDVNVDNLVGLQKFKEKLGMNFGRYEILGACHPESAYEAILAEENIGLMLPCNVIIYEEEGKTRISIIKPTMAMGMIDNDKLKSVAEKVELKLERVINSIV